MKITEEDIEVALLAWFDGDLDGMSIGDEDRMAAVLFAVEKARTARERADRQAAIERRAGQ